MLELLRVFLPNCSICMRVVCDRVATNCREEENNDECSPKDSFAQSQFFGLLLLVLFVRKFRHENKNQDQNLNENNWATKNVHREKMTKMEREKFERVREYRRIPPTMSYLFLFPVQYD